MNGSGPGDENSPVISCDSDGNTEPPAETNKCPCDGNEAGLDRARTDRPGAGAGRAPAGDTGPAAAGALPDEVREAVAGALAPVPMPADVSARLRARLATELGGSAHPDRTAHAAIAADRNPSRSRSDRNASDPARSPGPVRDQARIPHRARRAGVLLAAAAVVGALVALPALGRHEPGPAPVAATAPDALRAAAAGAVAERADGAAADPDRMRACLSTAGDPDPAAPLVASRPYPVAGEPGVLLVLGTPQTGRYRVVVLPRGCGRVLAETTVP